MSTDKKPTTPRSSSNTSLSSGSSNEDKNLESNKSDKSTDSGEKVILREKIIDNQSKEGKDKRKSWKDKKKSSPGGQIISRYNQDSFF